MGAGLRLLRNQIRDECRSWLIVDMAQKWCQYACLKSSVLHFLLSLLGKYRERQKLKQ